MPEKQIQDYLFQRIKEQLPASQSMVSTIATLLNVSHDSAYRRIRCETFLVLEEVKTLCQTFNISLDHLLQLTSNSIVFENSEMNNGRQDFKSFLEGLRHSIQQLLAAEEKNIFYLTSDLPFFYHFCFRPLIAFRYFFWMKTIFRHPDFQHRKFATDCLPPEVETLGKEILAAYCKMPSIEIWNTECINSTLLQLNYYIDAGLMTKEECREVAAGLHQTIQHLQVQAEHGCKFLPGENPASKKENFELFYNRVGLGGNTIMAFHDNRRTLFLNYDALNYLVTTDEVFCSNVYRQLQTVMQRSTLISRVSEKQRNMFFNLLYAKLPQQEFNNVNRAL